MHSIFEFSLRGTSGVRLSEVYEATQVNGISSSVGVMQVGVVIMQVAVIVALHADTGERTWVACAKSEADAISAAPGGVGRVGE